MNENKHEIDIMETSMEEAKKVKSGYSKVSTAEKMKEREPRGDKVYYTHSIEHPERDMHKIFFPRQAKITDVSVSIEHMEGSRVGVTVHTKVVGSKAMFSPTNISLEEGVNKLPDFEVIPNTVIALEAMGDDHTKIRGFHISYKAIQ